MRLQFDDEDENFGKNMLQHVDETINKAGKYLGRSIESKKHKTKKKVNKSQQKRRIKKEYVHAHATGASAYGYDTKPNASKGSSKIKRWFGGGIRKHKMTIILLIVIMFFFLFFLVSMGIIGTMVAETGGAVVESTYLSSDDDIYAVNERYTQMENNLQRQVDNIESSYSGYDEYRYQVDEISHEPYALISYLTAMFGDFKERDVLPEVEELFSLQYSMRVWDEVEIQTRIETKTGTRFVEDPETGEMVSETYEYEEVVEEQIRILNVEVNNKGLDAVAFQKLNEDGRRHYLIYQASLGNRSYLFGDRILIGNPAGGGISYDIPPEALTDERFAKMIREAEKYLGYPYVWGGSSPSTSFDCSGFVSWVVNNCGNGWSLGRLGCDGLMSHCTYVSPENAKPGDLIFFQGTYNTTGSSHVGIYVGNGMMIHCGDPIQYASIETSYWQQHFMCFGRLN